MRKPTTNLCVFGIAAVLALAGCASIMSGRHADVSIHSNVPNAHVVIRDKQGQQVAEAHTPATVSLKRKGRFLMPPRYTATVESPGYQTAQVPIRSTLNPWLLGNVVFGGVIGLVVDSATGASWKPKESDYFLNLTRLDPPEELVQPDSLQAAFESPVPEERLTEDEDVQPAAGVE